MKTLKQSLEESNANTAMSDEGVIYCDNKDGTFTMVLQGESCQIDQHAIDFDNDTYIYNEVNCRPLKG